MKRWMMLLCLLGIAAISLAALAARSEATLGASPAAQPAQGMSSVAAAGPQMLTDLVTQPGIYDWSFNQQSGLDPHRYSVSGSFDNFPWSLLEPQQDVYDFTIIHDFLELQDSLGKKSGIGVFSYNGRELGDPDTGLYMPQYVATDPNAVWQSWDGHAIPRYWDDAYLEPYLRFIDAFGEEFRNDDRIEFVAIGTGMYGEILPWNVSRDGNPEQFEPEFNNIIWVQQIVPAITDAFVEAFSESGELKKVLFNQTAPKTPTHRGRTLIADYSVRHGVGLSINGLYPEAWDAYQGWTGDEYSSWQGMFDQIMRYDEEGEDEGTGLPVPLAFETYNYMIGCDGGVSVYWAMLNGLDKHPQYLRIKADLLHEDGPNGRYDLPVGPDKTANIDLFRWVQPYLGATVDNTPSVWVAMRDVRSPWQTCWQANLADPTSNPEYLSQPGNYDFWLYQKENIAGGQTVVETSACTTYSGIPLEKPVCNQNLPPGREGWVIRRTNEPNNPHMFFDVDDDYIHGGTNAVTITVTYWDNATDTWRLVYDSVSGEKAATPQGSTNAWVQKMGSNSYQQAVFVIDDARLGDGIRDGRADFYIDSNDDGNEWIHFVDLTDGEFTPIWDLPTPTPTATATPTSTPTMTPTPRPQTGRVFGLVFDDLNENAMVDSGEPPVEGALIELLRDGTTLVRSQETAADGQYSFQDIDPGDYLLRETDPPGYRSTSLNEIYWTIGAGTALEWNFADRELPTPTPTDTPTATASPTVTLTPSATPTATATPTETPPRIEIYLPLAVKDS